MSETAAAMIVLVAVLLAMAALVVWLRTANAFPVLMFHNVDPERRDSLTVSIGQLEERLRWLHDHGYRSVTLAQLVDAFETGRRLAPRSFLITFDDGYQNNLLALPLLRQFGMTAVLFVPTAFVRQDGDRESNRLTVEQMRQMLPTFELALHSHRHDTYERLSATEIEADIAANVAAFDALGLPYLRVFAYPYGGRPRDPAVNKAMREAFRRAGIGFAFRIGNRLNRFPPRDRYELQRLDIRGTGSMARFVRQVRFGKLL